MTLLHIYKEWSSVRFLDPASVLTKPLDLSGDAGHTVSWERSRSVFLPVIIIRRQRRPFVAKEIFRVENRRNRIENRRQLRQIEIVRKVVGARVRIAKRRQIENSIDQLQDTAEIVRNI